MKLYEVKALAHETQSRIRQDLNAWNDFLEHASRVYRYRFMDQILIYAQRPDAVEALSVSMGEKAAVDLEYMEGLTGKSREEIISDLKGIIFKVPESGTWQTSEEYLSGNIRKKLISAEKALQGDASYSDNVEYLKKAMPKPLTASEIEVRLGATWINAEYIEQFMKDVLHTPQRLFSREWVAVKFAPINCEWNIKGSI